MLICIELATGAKLIYFSPYSLDFNPIEQAFNPVKAWLWRHEAEAVLPEAHPWQTQQVTMSITVEDMEGWIINSEYCLCEDKMQATIEYVKKSNSMYIGP